LNKLNKRESKHAEKDTSLRMNLDFKLLIGDDTGLIKSVKMKYNYQTNIIGSYMKFDKDDDKHEDD
jgi:hypothetical protein